jgi:hypothetical protein
MSKTYDLSFSRAKDAIREKILDYAARYGPITVRGLYYAVLAAGLIDKSEDNSKKIGRLFADLRRKGELDWDRIVDGSRTVHEPWTHRTVREGVEDMLGVIRIDPWASMRETVMVLIEKDALTGVIEPVTGHYAVPLYPVRGYNSLTKLREIAGRIVRDGRPCTVYQLGDLDPSGDHATEEARQEILDFVVEIASAEDMPIVTFERLAITRDEVDTLRIGDERRRLAEFGRETKRSDPRVKGYEAKYGAGFESFELDIIPPPMLRAIVLGAIRRHIADEEIEACEREARRQVEEIRGMLESPQ